MGRLRPALETPERSAGRTVDFWPRCRASLLGRPAAVALVVLVALCREQAGALLVPVIGYGPASVTMAVPATGLGRTAGVGGVIFLLSDSLIAVRAFTDMELPGHSFWVMLTYVAGQGLLPAGVVAADRGPAGAESREHEQAGQQ